MRVCAVVLWTLLAVAGHVHGYRASTDKRDVDSDAYCAQVLEADFEKLQNAEKNVYLECVIAQSPTATRMREEAMQHGVDGKMKFGGHVDPEHPPPTHDTESQRRASQAKGATSRIAQLGKRLKEGLKTAHDLFADKRKTADEKRDDARKERKEKDTKVREVIERVAQRAQEGMRKTLTAMDKRNEILAERKAMDQRFREHKNMTQWEVEYWDWRQKYNESFVEAGIGGNWTVPHYNETEAHNAGLRAERMIKDQLEEMRQKIASNETRTWYIEALYNHTGWDPDLKITKNATHNLKLAHKKVMRIWREKYDKIYLQLDTPERRAFVQERRKARLAAHAARQLHPNLQRSAARVSNATYHAHVHRHSFFNGDEARKKYEATRKEKYKRFESFNDPDSTFSVVLNNFVRKYGFENATFHHDLDEHGIPKFIHEGKTGLHWLIRKWPEAMQSRLGKSLIHVQKQVYNRTLHTQLTGLLHDAYTVIRRNHEDVTRKLKHGDEEWLPDATRRYFNHESKRRIITTYARVINGKTYILPRVTPKKVFNATTVQTSIIDFFNETFFGCVTDLIAEVYCFPFVDPNISPIPNIPDKLNITDRVPVNCTEHLIEVHGRADGGIVEYFDRIGDWFGWVFTYVPGLNRLTFLGWDDNDIRRDLQFEVWVCGFPEVILFFFALFVLAIFLPFFAQWLQRVGDNRDKLALEKRVTALEMGVLAMHPRLEADPDNADNAA